MEATFGGLAIPASESFKETERTKTWKSVTIRQIGSEIAKKYGLGFCYDANKISIAKIEQSEKTDSAFFVQYLQQLWAGYESVSGENYHI